MERILFIVTYSGDITEKLKACGTQCPYRLTPEGNTEQQVECFRGLAASRAHTQSLVREIAPILLKDCAKNGTVINFRWVITNSDPVQKD